MRRRITALVAATTSVVLLAFLVPAAVLVARVARADAERQAQSALQALVPLVAAGDAAGVAVAVQRISGDGFPAWVTGTDADAGAGGAGTGGTGATAVTVGTDPSGGAYSRTAGNAAAVRTVGGSPGGTLFVQPVSSGQVTSVVFVLAPTARLSDGVLRIRLVLGALGVVLFLLALLVAGALARGIARPVVDLAATAARLAGGDLAARVDPAGPREVQEVGTALNRLARRISELLAAERESVADLSHRLRTPVTALRLEAGALADPGDRVRVQEAVDELDRAVDAIIRQARAPVAADLTPDPRCDAAASVAARLAFWAVLAAEEDRPVRADIAPGTWPVAVAEADLAAALDALLGNVFAHTPRGTPFEVAVRPVAGGRVEVVVADDGPGLPRPDLLTRGVSGGGSTGLGLSIVRRTADGAGGAVVVGRRPTGGLEVALVLPAAPAV